MRTASRRAMRIRARQAMRAPSVLGTADERERLERFLEWRRVTGRAQRKAMWPSLAYRAGVVLLIGLDVGLVVVLSGVLRDGRGALAPQAQREPLANVGPPPADSPSVVPPSDPSTAANVASAEPSASSREADAQNADVASPAPATREPPEPPAPESPAPTPESPAPAPESPAPKVADPAPAAPRAADSTRERALPQRPTPPRVAGRRSEPPAPRAADSTREMELPQRPTPPRVAEGRSAPSGERSDVTPGLPSFPRLPGPASLPELPTALPPETPGGTVRTTPRSDDASSARPEPPARSAPSIATPGPSAPAASPSPSASTSATTAPPTPPASSTT